jgi:hypothetical protein
MSSPHEYKWKRDHREEMTLLYLSIIFFTAALACTIAIVWNPTYWVQIAVTDVLLLVAGAACKGGRT